VIGGTASGNGLDPAKGILDPFPDPLTHGAAFMSGGARGPDSCGVGRRVRRWPWKFTSVLRPGGGGATTNLIIGRLIDWRDCWSPS
jgi:hypothetical protein